MSTVFSDESCYDEVVSQAETSERSIGSLSDELWLRVLRLGVDGGCLDHKDLYSLACVSHRLSRLSSSDDVWQRVFNSSLNAIMHDVNGEAIESLVVLLT